MIQTKEQIIEIAKQVMADVEWPYDQKKGVVAIFVSLEEQYERWKNMEGFEENKHKIYAYWDVFLDFPEEEGWQGRNMYYIEIRDEDGEPYLIGHKQAKLRVVKNTDGKYEMLEFPRR